VSIAYVSAADIDEASNAGAYDASHIGLFLRTVQGLAPEPDFVVFDHYQVPGLGIPSKSFSGGEKASATVAAASIVAKVVLDQMMVDFDRQFPQWGFAGNKGYRGNDGRHAGRPRRSWP
jgi:ribonuclease HII